MANDETGAMEHVEMPEAAVDVSATLAVHEWRIGRLEKDSHENMAAIRADMKILSTDFDLIRTEISKLISEQLSDDSAQKTREQMRRVNREWVWHGLIPMLALIVSVVAIVYTVTHGGH